MTVKKNQVTKNAVAGDPLDTSITQAVENMSVSKPIATEEPNTTRQYIDGMKKIKDIVTAKADKGDQIQPMNGAAKSDMDESISVTDSINALFEGSELTPEFKEKMITIFEAAVKEKTYELMSNLEEHYNSTLEAEIETISEVLIDAIDQKIDYISSVWLEENEIAIENGLKVELFENFVYGMKTLFQENYVDIPEERYDVLADMNAAVIDLQGQLNEQIEINSLLSARIQESLVESTINEVGDDLSESQKDKLRFLSENISFTSESQLMNKIKILKESTFPSTKRTYTILEEEVSGIVGNNLSETMDKYVNAL